MWTFIKHYLLKTSVPLFADLPPSLLAKLDLRELRVPFGKVAKYGKTLENSLDPKTSWLGKVLYELQCAATIYDLQTVADILRNPMKKLWEFKFGEVFKSAKEFHLNEIQDRNPTILLKKVPPNLFSIQKR